MNAARFHNSLRIMLNLEAGDLMRAGIVDENWGTVQASDRDQVTAFVNSPFRESLRMPDATFERLFALLESRQKPADAIGTVEVLTKAESFISGFEDDPSQEGTADILAGLRAAIPREQSRAEGRADG